MIPKIKDFDHFFQGFQKYQALHSQPDTEASVMSVLRSLVAKIGHGKDSYAQEQMDIAAKEILALFSEDSSTKQQRIQA